MRKRWLGAMVSILGMLIILFYGFFKQPSKVNRYFAPVAISKWTNSRSPCLSIQIGDVRISTMIDLGFRGQFSINSDLIGQIKEKTYLGSVKRYEFNGKEFEKKVFEIPIVEGDGLIFYQAIVQEEKRTSNSNTCIYTENETPSLKEPGKIGWEAFGNLNLLLDLGNEKIAVCDSVATLIKEGYSTEFTSTLLILERGLVEIDLVTSNGSMRCVLDTGCTYNCIHSPDLVGQTKFDMQNIYKLSQFNIGEKKFGSINFLRIPIQLPIQVDAILGMEFFNDHIVFLDFKNNRAYISK